MFAHAREHNLPLLLITLIILIILITLITPITLIIPITQTTPIIHPTLKHPFFNSPLFHKPVLHGDQQLIKHIHSLMNQRNTKVRYLLVVHLLDCGGIVLPELFASRILSHLLIPRMKIAPLL